MGHLFVSSIAEAVGQRILSHKGAELIEFLYFLEEEHTLPVLRAFSSLGRADQKKILVFLEYANQRKDLRISVTKAGLEMRRPGG